MSSISLKEKTQQDHKNYLDGKLRWDQMSRKELYDLQAGLCLYFPELTAVQDIISKAIYHKMRAEQELKLQQNVQKFLAMRKQTGFSKLKEPNSNRQNNRQQWVSSVCAWLGLSQELQSQQSKSSKSRQNGDNTYQLLPSQLQTLDCSPRRKSGFVEGETLKQQSHQMKSKNE